ncbi:transmembrane protein (macronuclear) [Tetrahymena thermophila SB210]|uniref:Transmembrane protein n=1 Tax=Tetrahymena thermophila (strain SB210) TaxID=312017 RepID=I7LZS7_TETTS|nr:transmembrane protein [Tetrahymena thermophila SB210]EAR84841.1 transmembrane protein [Tetrahymena thermophila SB210]|eukprot:XP_001032504.1 transmembrane protein [Tetrahymena thermophila SB210]
MDQNCDTKQDFYNKKQKQIFSKYPIDFDKHFKNLFLRLGLDENCFGKTEHCKHPNSCFVDILKYSLKSFLMGYSVTAAIDIIVILVKQFKKLKSNPFFLLITLISKKNIRFALFPALYTLIMRGLTCLLRRIFKQDNNKISFISGFIGGLLSLWVREKQNRSIWALFLITRALDSLYRYQLIRKRIPKFDLDYTFVYCLMIGFTVSIYFTEPSCNSRGLHKAWENFSCEDISDYGIRFIYNSKMNKELAIKGIPPDEPNKYINWNRKF